jgi:predicted lipoprotein with Yx(FWY)xxD motif
MRAAIAVVLVSVGVLVVGCAGTRDTGSSATDSTSASSSATVSPSSDDNQPAAPDHVPQTAVTETYTEGPSPTKSARPGTTITVGASQFGPVLFDRTGQAIYLFEAEKTAKPNCYGDCARVWPPVLTTGPPIASAAVRQSQLGTTARSDGSIQVTYSGRPLYFYAREGKHQVLCHNVSEFGARWLAITATGAPAPT